MLRRRIKDEAEARACLEEVESSGLTRREWANRNGVDGRSLQAWRMILQRIRGHQAPATLRLVELIPTARPDHTKYTVRCGSFSVQVDEHFDPAVLRRLLSVVAGC